MTPLFINSDENATYFQTFLTCNNTVWMLIPLAQIEVMETKNRWRMLRWTNSAAESNKCYELGIKILRTGEKPSYRLGNMAIFSSHLESSRTAENASVSRHTAPSRIGNGRFHGMLNLCRNSACYWDLFAKFVGFVFHAVSNFVMRSCIFKLSIAALLTRSCNSID